MSLEFEWDVDPLDAFIPMTEDYIQRIYAEIAAIFMRYAPLIESWLKQNAAWEDQTGNLRQSLHAELVQLGTDLAIQFDYGLDYGVFLEFANAGRYAVIAPALDYFAPKIWQEIKELFA